MPSLLLFLSTGKVLFHPFHSRQYSSARKCRSSCGQSRKRAGICCPGV